MFPCICTSIISVPAYAQNQICSRVYALVASVPASIYFTHIGSDPVICGKICNVPTLCTSTVLSRVCTSTRSFPRVCTVTGSFPCTHNNRLLDSCGVADVAASDPADDYTTAAASVDAAVHQQPIFAGPYAWERSCQDL